jgi:membrane associated rhomboid family serine protease
MDTEPTAAPPTPYSPPATFTLAGYKPRVIMLVAAVCVVLFCGLNAEPVPITWASYGRWGAPNAPDVWNGAFWGVITSNFVHLAIWHLGFNLYWLWIFGRKIEFERGWQFTLLLIFTAALATSSGELALAGTTGIGLSGVVYAFFGFIFISAKFDARFQHFLSPQNVRLFIGWLFLCILLTMTKVLPVGNAGHFAGLLWGALAAWLLTQRPLVRYGVGIALLALLSVPAFWAPWSAHWLVNRAYNYHVANNLPQAKHYYELALQREATDSIAQKNLNNIRIFELSKQVQSAAIGQKRSELRKICQQILAIDPSNSWAQAMLQTSDIPARATN